MASKYPDEIQLISFKFFIQKFECSTDPEVRKVTLECESTPTLKSLHRIVDNLLTTFDENNVEKEKISKFSIQYIDSEGDKITVKTDSELKTFFQEQQTLPYKMYIQCLDESGNPGGLFGNLESQNQPVCTSCHLQIKGFCYACLLCPEFQICSRCEKRGVHPGHVMIRFSTTTFQNSDLKILRIQEFYATLCNAMASQGEFEKEPSKSPQACKSRTVEMKAEATLNPTNGSKQLENQSLDFQARECSSRNESSLSSSSFESVPSPKEIEDLKFVAMPPTSSTCLEQNATHSIMEKTTTDSDKQKSCVEAKSVLEGPKKSSSKSKLDSKKENGNEAAPKEESIESLREEIDQLLAPIISNQNEITVNKIRISPDLDSLVLVDFENQNLDFHFAGKRSNRSSPPSFTCDIVEKAVIENNCPSQPRISQESSERNIEVQIVLKNSSQEQNAVVAVPRKSSRETNTALTAASQLDLDSIEVVDLPDVGSSKLEEKDGSAAKSSENPEITSTIIGGQQKSENVENVQNCLAKENLKNNENGSNRRNQDYDIESHYLTSSRIMLKNHLDRFNHHSNDNGKSDLLTKTSQDPLSLPVHRSYTTLRSLRASMEEENLLSPNASKSYSSTVLDTPTYIRTSSQYRTPTSSRISDALDQMLSMGFSDDDGWLTQLLTMKHGNIEQVLDILTPVKQTTNT